MSTSETTRIAVLTDIHALSATLASALSAARAEGFDAMLILGDLLTYGVRPAETLDLVQDAVDQDGAILLSGNHDLLYTADADAVAYAASLPDWLRESIDWTARRVPAGVMDSFAWQNDWAQGSLFAAHANPYPFGDWRYIRSAADAQAASPALAERGYRFGLFGHSHRMRRYDCDTETIFTLASLGQPRDDRDRTPRWAMVTLDQQHVTVESRPVSFNTEDHMKAIHATSMTASTRERLCRFFA